MPSAALAPELIEDYDGRTRIVNFRIFFRTIAGLLVTVLGLEVFMREESDGSGGATEQAGYFGFSLTMSLIMFAVIIVSAAARSRERRNLHGASCEAGMSLEARRRSDIALCLSEIRHANQG